MSLPAGPHRFRTAGLTVLAGSASGHAIGLALVPVISRLFTPDVYGEFSAMVAVVATFVGVSTLRLEILAQKVPDDEQAAAMSRLALALSGGLAFALSLAAIVVVVVTGVTAWWLAVGPLVVMGSAQLVGTSVLARARRYRPLALANFAQAAGTAVLHAVLGLFSAGVGSLLVGFGAGRLGWLPAMRSLGRRGVSPARKVWSLHRRAALTAGSSALVNSLAGQVPVLLGIFLYGSAAAGLLAMALRVLVSPLTLVGQAAAAASLGEIGQSLREGDRRARGLVVHGLRDLMLVGLLPCLAAGLLGVQFLPWLLGDQWSETGTLVALLSVGALAQFVVSPFSQLLNVTGQHRQLARWDVTRLAMLVLVFSVPAAFGAPFATAIGTYSASLVVLYLWLARLCVRAVESPTVARAS